MELCLFEILASDNQTVEEALAAYNESLLSGTDDGPSSVTDEGPSSGTDEGPSSALEMLYSPAVRQTFQAVKSQICPGRPSCTGQGTCSNSVCTCNTGKFYTHFIHICGVTSQ